MFVKKDDEVLIIEKRSEREPLGKKAKEDWTQIKDVFDKKGICSIRIVFAHSKNSLGENGYRFMGVFRLKCYGAVLTDGLPGSLTWERVSTEVKVDEWTKIVESLEKYKEVKGA